ncbi:LysR family transcriptional regulator [Klebsiella pneumoniae]|nr:LysR family transcriptional regulator [Klebsiella pneumoniae]
MSESRPESYWPHLYWLTVLEEQKSYTRAAEKLGISKSAISQKISELERVTGKTLVHRTTRSVSLSDDGLRLGGGAQRAVWSAAGYFHRRLR